MYTSETTAQESNLISKEKAARHAAPANRWLQLHLEKI